MGIDRRSVLAGIVMSPIVAARHAQAQAFPSRSVSVIVPFPAGGPVDVATRIVVEGIQRRANQAFVVDNRPGANGATAGIAAARSAPDGYTLMAGNVDTNTLNLILRPEHTFKADDLSPVGLIGSFDLALIAKPKAPFETATGMIEAAKAQPWKISFASWGAGSLPHIIVGLIKTATGAEFLHVPYRGLPQALQDLAAGFIDVFVVPIPVALDFAASGRVKILATLTQARTPSTPTVPTAIEQGLPGVVADIYIGLFAPRGTPAGVKEWLNQEMNTVLRTPEAATRLATIGLVPKVGSAADFGALLAAETKRWGKVIADNRITVDGAN